MSPAQKQIQLTNAQIHLQGQKGPISVAISEGPQSVTGLQ